MEEEFKKSLVNEPDLSYGNNSYADYLTWDMDEMVELIKGKVFKKAAAAPRRIHLRFQYPIYWILWRGTQFEMDCQLLQRV
jgi:hypothetical protein